MGRVAMLRVLPWAALVLSIRLGARGDEAGAQPAPAPQAEAKSTAPAQAGPPTTTPSHGTAPTTAPVTPDGGPAAGGPLPAAEAVTPAAKKEEPHYLLQLPSPFQSLEKAIDYPIGGTLSGRYRARFTSDSHDQDFYET